MKTSTYIKIIASYLLTLNTLTLASTLNPESCQGQFDAKFYPALVTSMLTYYIQNTDNVTNRFLLGKPQSDADRLPGITEDSIPVIPTSAKGVTQALVVNPKHATTDAFVVQGSKMRPIAILQFADDIAPIVEIPFEVLNGESQPEYRLETLPLKSQDFYIELNSSPLNEDDIIMDTGVMNSFYRSYRSTLYNNEKDNIRWQDAWFEASNFTRAHWNIGAVLGRHIQDITDAKATDAEKATGHINRSYNVVVTPTAFIETLGFQSGGLVLVHGALTTLDDESVSEDEKLELYDQLLATNVGKAQTDDGHRDRQIILEALIAKKSGDFVAKFFTSDNNIMKPLLRNFSPDFQGEANSFPIQSHYEEGFMIVLKTTRKEYKLQVFPTTTAESPELKFYGPQE